MDKSMYDRIRDTRKAQGMSQEDLAYKVGYKGRSMIARVEAGQVDLPQSKIVAFAEALGVTTEYLMDGDQDTANILEQIRDDQRELFRLARSAKPEAIRAAVAVLQSMKETNKDF